MKRISMDSVIVVLIIVILFLSFITTIHLFSIETNSRLEINILGDPLSNITYTEISLYLGNPVTGVIEIPLILDYEVAILNITGYDIYGETHDLMENTSIDYSLKTIFIDVNDITSIIIKMFNHGVFEVEGFDSYSINVDLSRISSDIGVSCSLKILGNYTPIVISSGSYSIERKQDLVIIRLNDREEYLVVLYTDITEEELPPILTPEQPAEKPGIDWSTILIVLAAMVAGSLFLVLYYFRKRAIIVEEISSKDLLLDDVNRKIIEAVGDAGEKGLVQARLPEIVGKPKSTISRKVKKLSKEGYISVSRKGKINILKLTEKGLEAYKKIKKGS